MPKISLVEIKNILRTFQKDKNQFSDDYKPIPQSEQHLYIAPGDSIVSCGIFDHPKLNLSAILSAGGYDLDLSDYDFSGEQCSNINFGTINLTYCKFLRANLSFALFNIHNKTRLTIKIDSKTKTSGCRGLGKLLKPLKSLGNTKSITGFLQPPKDSPFLDFDADVKKTSHIADNSSLLLSHEASQKSRVSKSSSQPSKQLAQVVGSCRKITSLFISQPLKSPASITNSIIDLSGDSNVRMTLLSEVEAGGSPSCEINFSQESEVVTPETQLKVKAQKRAREGEAMQNLYVAQQINENLSTPEKPANSTQEIMAGLNFPLRGILSSVTDELYWSTDEEVCSSPIAFTSYSTPTDNLLLSNGSNSGSEGDLNNPIVL